MEVLLYDDGGGVQAAKSLAVQWLDNDQWKDVTRAQPEPAQPVGGVANTIHFDSITTSKLRVVFEHKGAARSGVTEIEAWEK